MDEKNSATIEDYLAILLVMQRDGAPVVGARLAELLGVTPPTVTNTLKRMARDGLVTLREGQGLFLTEKGLERAQSVTRRHMLTEWMLMRMLQVPWSQTHSEAHQMEHTVSERVAEQMWTRLGNPQTCPHGNPLPGYEQAANHWLPLMDAAAGARVIIRRIHEMGEDRPDLLQYLEENGLTPGVEVEILEVLPFNETLTLRVNERTLALGFSAARFIFVERCDPGFALGH